MQILYHLVSPEALCITKNTIKTCQQSQGPQRISENHTLKRPASAALRQNCDQGTLAVSVLSMNVLGMLHHTSNHTQNIRKKHYKQHVFFECSFQMFIAMKNIPTYYSLWCIDQSKMSCKYTYMTTDNTQCFCILIVHMTLSLSWQFHTLSQHVVIRTIYNL